MTIVNSFLNPSSRWYYPLHWLVLILLGLAIYTQTFGYNFLFDDLGFIVHNPYITKFSYVHYLWKTYPLTRAVGFYSFALNYHFNQLNPIGYHLFNFIIHLIAVGLVWALASVLFKIVGPIHQELPYVIAVVFCVHPCQTQAVTYISQRFESLATVFYLGSIYCYLQGRITSLIKDKYTLFACSIGFAILGVFTKEVAATIPVMVLASEFILFNEKRFTSLMVGGILFFLLFMKLVHTDLNIFFHFQPIPSDSHDGDIITAKNYLLTQLRVFLTFIRLLVLPINQDLDYDYPLSKGLLGPPLTLVGLFLIVTIIITVFKLRKKFPIISFGLAWVLITFSINLAPRANVIFEHKLYLISFGFFLVFISTLFVVIRQRTLLMGVLIAMITILALMSFWRNQVWRDELTFWNDVVGKSPHKARAYDNRGNAYVHQGNFIQALGDFNKAIELKPVYADAYYNRGGVNDHLGNFKQAIFDYTKAIEINPKFAEAFNNLGSVYDQQGNFNQALFDYNKAIELNPEYADAYYNRVIAYYQMKKYDMAWQYVHQAEGIGISINPPFIESLKELSGRNQ